MKKVTFLILTFVMLGGMMMSFTVFSGDKTEIKEMEIGEKLPMSDVKMQDISGKMISLDDAMGENGLLLNFSCNTCPFVIAWEDRYPEVEKLAQENGIGVVLVNSNTRKRNGDDSFEEMQVHAKEYNYNSYYVVDEKNALADAIGAFTTPHVFLFNADKELVYKGAIDDNWKSKEGVKEKYLNNAITNLVTGKEISPNATKGRGCSIKRGE